VLRAGTWSISAGVAVVAVAIVVKSAATYAPALALDGSRSEHLSISVIQKWHSNRPASLTPAVLPVPNDSAAHIRTAISPPEATPFEDTIFFEEHFSFQARLPSFDERFGAMPQHAVAADTEQRVYAPEATIKSASPRAGPALYPGAPGPIANVNSGVRAPLARQASLSSPDNQNRTAIYDISSHVVYLPNGRRLEAHSGFDSYMDDPRYVHVKSKGSTPPNTYRLVPRESLFHGVQAIRLIPVGTGNMFGRDGILAHHYLLGPNGQSNGCVSFANYPEFLNAYLNGEIDRLVVVERLENPPSPMIATAWLTTAIKGLFKPFERGPGT
jgi:type VI secretion system (T6SS) effector TldE1-like protein